MTSSQHVDLGRLTGTLMLTSLTAMIAGAAIVLPSGLTLNPDDPAAVLAAVTAQTALHLVELGFDVVGWLALTAAAFSMAAGAAQARQHTAIPAAGLLAAAGVAGLLHDAGDLALTQLAGHRPDGSTVVAVLLVAKWTVNLAGLLWVAATAATVLGAPMARGLRRAGALAAMSGLVAVAVPWTTGSGAMSSTMEQIGYLLHLPIMIWYGVLGWRYLRGRGPGTPAERSRPKLG